jgi:tape measure domain-containing protein
MAANIGHLNVRIGADITALERSIRTVERTVSRAADNLANMGNRMALGLTLPLAGFGVAAIQAAGQAESMRKAMETTMNAAGYSIGQARTELEALRDAAKAPGLDFEQAVKGSVRLQNVGFSAEKAREILVQLANAVAMSGGSAQELDGVTRQFGQMIAKGRVLQEDLSIIQENMPAVSQAMEKAFGTKSAEKLREMGITAEQFVDGVTKQLGKLPRVSGGIANSIVNAQVAIKQALATVGESLNKTFNVTSNLDRFGDWLTQTADWFAKLSDGTQRTAAAIGVFALALGPALRVGGFFVQALGAAYTGLIRMRVAMLAVQGGGFIAWWKTLDFAMRASILGATVGIVLALALAFKAAARDMTPAAQAARAVNEATKEAERSIAAEVAELERLKTTVRSSTASQEEKNQAYRRLGEIMPGTLKDYKTEAERMEAVTKAINEYIKKIEIRAKLAAMNKRLIETEEALYDTQKGLNEEADPSIWQTAGNMLMAFGNAGKFVEGQMRSQIKNGGELTTTLTATKNALLEEIKALELQGAATGETTTKTKDLTTATKEDEKAAKKAAKAREELGKVIVKQFSEMEKLPTMAGQASPSLATGGGGINDPVAQNTGAEGMRIFGQLPAVITPAQAAMDSLTSGVSTFGEVWDDVAARMMASGKMMQMAIAQATFAMEEYASKGGTSFKEFGKEALGAAAKVVRSFIMQGVAAAASKALMFLPFPANIVGGAIAGAAAGVLFNKLINSIGIPALAEGGLASAPTLAMIGDNPNASIDPEVVAPLSKLQSMMGGGGGQVVVGGQIRFNGRDFIIDLENAQRQLGRARG